MAHIPEGIISGSLATYGFALSGVLSVCAGRTFTMKNIPKISLVTAAVFCASVLHFPLLGTSVHFTFVGLAGILLGPAAFLSVLVAVLFQGMLFQHGGLSTLGVNAFNMGMAALAGHYLFQARHLFPRMKRGDTIFALLAGFGAALIMVALLAATLLLTGFPGTVVGTLFAIYIPVIFGEGLATGFLAAALVKSGKKGMFYENS